MELGHFDWNFFMMTREQALAAHAITTYLDSSGAGSWVHFLDVWIQ